MGLLGPTFNARRWERARGVVQENLRLAGGGLPSIAVVDRLTEWGFHEEEAMAVLRTLQEQNEVALVGGRWVLVDGTADRRKQG